MKTTKLILLIAALIAAAIVGQISSYERQSAAVLSTIDQPHEMVFTIRGTNVTRIVR